MTDYESYSSRRMKAGRGGSPVVYGYDQIPREMRLQAGYALEYAIGPLAINESYDEAYPNRRWEALEDAVKEEHGWLHLPSSEGNARDRIFDYMAELQDAEQVLDVIEIGFRLAQEDDYLDPEEVEEAINRLNRRFKQHDLGYEFVGCPGIIIRVDSQYVQAEVVEPAIALLHAAGFQGPLDEFLKAHREYRRGDMKDAMNDALKAFESTMKAICDARRWSRGPKWTAAHLINAMFVNGLIPPMLESYFGGLRSILESGVPVLRNKRSGHGQGSQVASVPDYLAAFTLHLTAANIVFLMSAFSESP
jgi:hypothetical protein